MGKKISKVKIQMAVDNFIKELREITGMRIRNVYLSPTETTIVYGKDGNVFTINMNYDEMVYSRIAGIYNKQHAIESYKKDYPKSTYAEEYINSLIGSEDESRHDS